jgi:Pentapeptide repeats (8 copies)
MRRVLWAIVMVVALATTALLIADLYPGIWKAFVDGRVAKLIALVVALTAITILIVIGGRSLEWTGFGEKKLWDWQTLLFVPITVALIASLITLYQTTRQQEVEALRTKEAQQLEALRAERATMQAYLEHMGMLLLEKDLRTEDENSDVRLLARARTLAVLDAVSGDRKVRVLEFLFETNLIQFGPRDKLPVISLRFADLRETPLGRRFILRNTDLDRADLTKAKLPDAKLNNAKLPQADLREADLSGTDLSGANLSGANLSGADLSNAKGVTCQQTEQAKSLEGATMPDGQKYEDWLKDQEGCGEDGENSGPSHSGLHRY